MLSAAFQTDSLYQFVRASCTAGEVILDSWTTQEACRLMSGTGSGDASRWLKPTAKTPRALWRIGCKGYASPGMRQRIHPAESMNQAGISSARPRSLSHRFEPVVRSNLQSGKYSCCLLYLPVYNRRSFGWQLTSRPSSRNVSTMRNLDCLTSLNVPRGSASSGANWWFYFYGNPPALLVGREVLTR